MVGSPASGGIAWDPAPAAPEFPNAIREVDEARCLHKPAGMTLRPIVYAALALLIELIPAVSQAGYPPTILAPGLSVSPGACTGTVANPMCVNVPATSKVLLTCTANKGRDSMIGASSPVTAFRFAVSEGTLAAAEVAVTPAATATASVEWTTPVGPNATATCWAVGGTDVSTPSQAALLLVTPPPQPEVVSVVAPAGPVLIGTTQVVTVLAKDPQGGAVTYAWSASAGSFTGQGTPVITWTAPEQAGAVELKVLMTVQGGGQLLKVIPVEVVPSLFQGKLPVGLRTPRRVASTPTGELAVADGSGQLWLLTKLGGLRAKPVVADGVVAVAASADAFYASTTKGDVLKVDVATGKTVARYRLKVSQGPTGLAWDAGRNLLWMTHRAAGAVQAIRPDGSSAVTISSAGAGALLNPYDVAVDAATGTVWVAQDGNVDGSLVHAFQGDGTYVRSIVSSAQVYRAGGLAAQGGKIYVSDAYAGRVQVVTESGAAVGSVGAFGSEPGQLRQPAGMTFLQNGDLLVANLDGGRLERFGVGTAMVGCAGDSDCDGLTDAAELAAGLDANDASDALADADGDGLSNQDELKYGTNWRLADSDGDGVSDRDELLAGFNPLDPADHKASLVASAPALTGPGQVKVAGVAAGSGACAVAWKQVSGPAVTLAGADTASPSFVARTAGTYVLEGVATCGAGSVAVKSAPARVAVSVTNAAPQADAGRVAVVAPGELLELSAARSTDANGDALTFAWDPPKGPAAVVAVKGAKLAVTPLGVGYQTFKVTARDARGQAGVAEVPVIVVEAPAVVPTAMAVSTVLTGQVGVPVQLEVVSQGGTAFTWEQVSGPLASGLDASAAAPTFVPTAAGKHVFRATAWNGALRSAPETVTVYVGEGGVPLPAAVAKAPARAAVNAAIALDGTASQAAGGGTLGYRWRQVAGPAAGLTEADRATATAVAFAPGYYEFELSVAEGAVAGVPAKVAVEVLANGKPLPVAVPQARGTALVGELVLLDGSASVGAVAHRWTQVAGPWVALRAGDVSPTFVAPAPGQYVFELEVDDGAARSKAQQVSVLVTGEAN